MTDRRLEYWLSPREWNPVKEMKRYEGLSMEERGRLIVALSELAVAILESRPDRDEVLGRKEPKPPEAEAWWLELVRRGREKNRGESG